MKKILENDMEETNEENNKGLWSDLEHEKFKEALFLVGKNIRDIQSHVQTRSLIQVKSHCQKFFISLESKFSKDFQKIVVKNEKMKLEDFAKKWTRNYINSNFLKIVEECKDFDAEDKSGRLCSIILKGITKKNTSEKETRVIKKCSCCSFGKKTTCDCFDEDCCDQDTEKKAPDKFSQKKISNKSRFSFSNLFSKDEATFLGKKTLSVTLSESADENPIFNKQKTCTINDNFFDVQSIIHNSIFDLNDSQHSDLFPSLSNLRSDYSNALDNSIIEISKNPNMFFNKLE